VRLLEGSLLPGKDADEVRCRDAHLACGNCNKSTSKLAAATRVVVETSGDSDKKPIERS
jgi:hypothetical protein